jgi:multicomponent Na+:H+ antiporter subunit D
MIAHSFTQITLFFVAHRFATAAQATHIDKLKSLGYRFPAASIFFVIASLSLVGIPPFAAANSMKLIFVALSEHHYSYILLPIIVLSIIATIYYIGRMVCFLYLGTAKPEKNIASDAVICLSTICIVTFPVVEKFLDGILWSIL